VNTKKTMDIEGVDKTMQTEKFDNFFNAAFLSLKTHFARWIKADLLPAALMSELPWAKIVARVILRIPPTQTPVIRDHHHPDYVFPYKSLVHDFNLVDCRFERWLNKMVAPEFGNKEADQLFPPEVIEGAKCVLNSYKYEAEKAQRTLDRLIVECEGNKEADEVVKANEHLQLMQQMYRNGRVNKMKGEAGVSRLRKLADIDNEPCHLQVYFWTNYLPLMSHTQRVERGVKEAGTVGKTGRSEQHRSALGIVRSLLVHDDALTKKTPAEKSLHLFASAINLFEEHEELKKDDGYNEWLEKTKDYIMGSEHFSIARSDEQIKEFREKGVILRAETAAQKVKGVDRTGATLNLFKYTKVLKGTAATGNGHQKELRQELIFRGVSSQDVDKLFAEGGWHGQVIATLVHLEKKRVRKETDGNEVAIELAKTFFKPLSGAKFEEITTTEASGGSKASGGGAKPAKRKALKPLENTAPKRKRCSKRNRY